MYLPKIVDLLVLCSVLCHNFAELLKALGFLQSLVAIGLGEVVMFAKTGFASFLVVLTLLAMPMSAESGLRHACTDDRYNRSIQI